MLNDGIEKISSFLRFWGRIKVIMAKEKFGTARIYVPELKNKYQQMVYGMAYSRAIKAYPKIKIELVIAADHPELIKERKAIMTMYYFRCFVEKLLQR